MAHADFVHLRVHSSYSLSEGAIKIPELVELCRRHAMPAVALADTGNLYGAMEFATAAAEAGVQPIIGCQLALRRPEDGERRGHGEPGRTPAFDTVVLLAQGEAGYTNLLRLVSRSFLGPAPNEPPHLRLEDLDGRTDELIALSGGPAGAVGKLLLAGDEAGAESTLLRLAALFRGRLYVELMRHGLESEPRLEPRLIELAYRHDLPLVATNEIFFADAGMYEAHDALLCIAEKAHLREPNRRRVTVEHRFKSPAEMRALFRDLPEAADNTLVIARRCAYVPRPRKPILPAFPTEGGVSEAEDLRRKADEGLERRLERHVFTPAMDEPARERAARPYRERLGYELGVIVEMGFPGYFLIVADFVNWARGQGIPVGPGRGSGAGSVVAWALAITDLDPLRFGLLFERFLNPERISMPDFDIDFCQDRRDAVIRYVRDKYGTDRVAQIITFGTLQARAVVRDVGRVLGMPYPQVDRISKLVPHNPARPVTLAQAIAAEPALQRMREEDPEVARLIDIALKLEGLYRHASTHAAGVVIGDRPLDELVPLQRDRVSGMPVTQFAMKYAEQAGLVKFDFLGLKTLTVLARAVDLIEKQGIAIDLSALPLDDPRVYEMLGRAEVMGVFQLESSGMRDVLRQLRPDRFEDIIALVALYRPGPMDNIPRYINSRRGKEDPDHLHPSLEGILKETSGVIIYQEQVMQIAQVLSGFSLGRADILRRAMGKKIKKEMEAQRKSFVDGAVARGVERERASLIFDQVNKFAGYGFNKSHAAAYAMVAYQTAYLKANHPVEFLAASMTLEIGNTDKLGVFRQELQRVGVPLLAPDVNRSEVVFSVEEGEGGRRAIRYALSAVRNVGTAAMEALVAERERGGPFKDLGDFARRLDQRQVNRRQLESLVAAGALDCLDPNRGRLFEAVEPILRQASLASSERDSAQHSLFGAGSGAPPAVVAPNVADWPVAERLKREFEAVGFYLSAHPLEAYERVLGRLGVVPSIKLAERLAGGEPGRIKLAGAVIGKQERTSKSGNPFAFVQLSDASGVFEVVVFSESLAASRELLESGAPLLIVGDARLEGDSIKITTQSIQALDQAARDLVRTIRVFVADEGALKGLHGIIQREAEGRGRISVVVPVAPHREVDVLLPGRFALTPAIRGALKAVPGVLDVRDG